MYNQEEIWGQDGYSQEIAIKKPSTCLHRLVEGIINYDLVN